MKVKSRSIPRSFRGVFRPPTEEYAIVDTGWFRSIDPQNPSAYRVANNFECYARSMKLNTVPFVAWVASKLKASDVNGVDRTKLTISRKATERYFSWLEALDPCLVITNCFSTSLFTQAPSAR
mmetsp:Transcript_24314/g.57765  ORF Transcript_24314/g.57765 Transcript_24314/m.57765 type:complete len:123 (-) Transcript_24314:743-1111(-)